MTFADQQNINHFSRLNQRLGDLEYDLSQLESSQEALNEINDELMLLDEDQPILYKLGDGFISMLKDQAEERLESDVKEVEDEMKELRAKKEQCEKEMEDLKIPLYAKFGDNISELPSCGMESSNFSENGYGLEIESKEDRN